ncbi:two-component system sensor histidine kinase KdpD [Xenorhabdus sp. SF857]|uniref:two-component system sensor histidine kinase KdpD n=1 Tax=Xenorhabdus bakwenae TaxID=3026967 RepID=UPI002557F149|nr:two-component system sensor histidine kinase KdpD [Xenorhabdus sp. SF857]WFQ81168.1 two-component system sensor histidine kinase KdpD [Xenorhabdus sp. SF857]
MEHNEPPRPDPDELLTLANEKPRGKLKIFFGACAGVGKTYAMLQEAQRLLAQGLDIIVGVVETHDRQETAALLKGLPRLPPKYFHHNARRIAAFDIDAALARHPAIILMDELAFSNPKGCRHPKRWQDVEELLEAGIDVLTTVNVQHLESLNDVVGGITGIRVRETVPDHIFDQADDVVLVDLPPDDLRQRLNDGKVYISGQAERAIEHFFRKGNLIALRELALRRTADRVDDQMRAFRDTRGKEPVWHTQENLLLCIGYNAGNEKLVRKAARLAAKLNCSWHAVYVETPRLHRLPESKRRTILQALKLAQDLGAETATLSDSDEEKAILRYAREHNLGKILIGRYYNSQVNFFGFKWHRDFSERLGKLGPDLDLIIVALENKKNRDKEPKDNRTFNNKWRVPIQGFLMATVLCALITLFSRTFLLTLDKANLVALYLLGVVIIALFYGRWPSVFAAFVNVISFDLFFVQPRWSLEVKNIQYLLTLAVMLIVGAVVGNLTSGIRYQARVARYREQRTRHLYEITRTLSKALNEEDVARISYHFLSNSFQAKTGLLLPDSNQHLYQVKSTNGGQMQVDEAIAKWCFEKKQPAGAGTDTLPGVPYQLLPIATPSQVFAVLAIESPNQRQLLVPEQQRLLQIFTGLIANALERLYLTRSAESARLETEREQLRNSLLAALSHDLLTPLTVLFGQAEILMLDLSTESSPHTQQVNQIRQQILSLSRLVNNLLDMARLQSGGIQLNLEWYPLEKIVGSALRALEHTLNRYTVALSLPDALLLHCDAVLLERVFINLLENAIKYTNGQTLLGIKATIEEKPDQKQVHIEIWNAGSGNPSGQEKLIFNKFSRANKDTAISGVGLGLAICRSIIEIHGGKIWAANNKKGGDSFHFLLPLEDSAKIENAPREI